ncbi:DUF3080 family protein [Polycyclovorans algicola]|uniref:DUF3080 family protein n=1 Tax=Polycyclovorans algicola TaxID=616992 RepID=UPI001376B4AF|nr:DUF3080 family protein [Polycyclovorans algicola]
MKTKKPTTAKADQGADRSKADFTSAFFMMVVGLLLGACSRGPEAMMADYTARIGRITDAPIARQDAEPLPYPRGRDRKRALPDVRARLMDLTDFDRCNLTQLIAERNSIMGRYWAATRRLDYEFRFSHRVADCHDWLTQQDTLNNDDEALLALLTSLRAVKAETRPLAWWAVTWASDEFARYFSASAPLPALDARAPVNAFMPLAGIAAALDDPPDGIALADVEAALQTLRSTPYGGGWVRAVTQMTQTLDAAAAALNSVDTSRLCPQAKVTPKARIFETVFHQHYALRLQPYLSALHRQGEAQQAALAPLLAEIDDDAPAAIKAYAKRALSTDDDSLWAGMVAARQRHTDAWQRVLGDCSAMPDGTRREAAS